MEFHFGSFMAGFVFAVLTPFIDIVSVNFICKGLHVMRCPKCRRVMKKRAYGFFCFKCNAYYVPDLAVFLNHWTGGNYGKFSADTSSHCTDHDTGTEASPVHSPDVSDSG